MAPLVQNWIVRKPVAASRGGIVASQNGVAAAIGAEVLAAGGSAVDAVVATAFALAVREPWNSGLGGIGFMVVYPPGGGRPEVVDFGPVAPADLYLAAGRRRPQYARAALLCGAEHGAGLCRRGRALRAYAVARPGRAGGGGGQ